MSQVSSNDTFDREVYKTRKREEKDRIFEMLSEETQKLLNPEKLKAYADVQARFLRSSVSNALLIGRQRPEATWIRPFDDWKNDNIFVNKGEKAILMLKPVTYERPDGSQGFASDVSKNFDVTQTTAMGRTISRKEYHEMSGMPSPEELLGAVRQRAMTTFVRDEAFRGRAVNMADLSVYLMAKHYRLDPPDVDFERIARFFEGRKEKDVRRELTAVKTAADEVNREMLARARDGRENER